MRYLSGAEVASCLARLDPVALVRGALQRHAAGGTVLPAEYGMRWAAPAGGMARSLGLPAYVGGDPPAAGVKIINANPDNVRGGLPRASGLIALFDPETARIRTLLEGAQVSAVRTAAVSTLAVEMLAGRPIERAAVFGAGVLAEQHLTMFAARIPTLRTVGVFDAEPARAASLCRRLHPLGPSLAPAQRPADIARGADLVVAVTTTTEPYLGLADVARGSVLMNVSLDDFGPDLLLGADRLIVDSWQLVAADEHRMLGRLARKGLIVGPGETPAPGGRAVDAELADLIAGRRPGRTGAGEIIVVNPFGMAIFDIAVASAVEAAAAARGLGRALDP